MEQISLSWGPARRSYTVSELNGAIGRLLEADFADIWVSGEISGVRIASSGHAYFTLKDAGAQIKCVCFRGALRWIKARPQDGMAVLTRGRIDVYEPRGEYQLQVEAIEPQGFGALQFAFEQLKTKLAEEGLFDSARKSPLPVIPRSIGIVTSPQGAVIRDLLHVLRRRLPGLHIRLYPAAVQGAGSVEAVCDGIRYFSRLEDLWTFNEEAVARAIAASTVPIISAVGHETDFTIADFVADLRAPTPSAAAELAVPTLDQLLERVATVESRLAQTVRYKLAMAARHLHRQGVDRAAGLLTRSIGRRLQRIDECDRSLRERSVAVVTARRQAWLRLDARLRLSDPRVRLANVHRRLERAQTELERLTSRRTVAARAILDPLQAKLAELSPLKILDRGYAIVTSGTGTVLRDAATVEAGERLDVRLARGELVVRVESAGAHSKR
jgi:exodeoxyribonuclease VII large subunit